MSARLTIFHRQSSSSDDHFSRTHNVNNRKSHQRFSSFPPRSSNPKGARTRSRSQRRENHEMRGVCERATALRVWEDKRTEATQEGKKKEKRGFKYSIRGEEKICFRGLCAIIDTRHTREKTLCCYTKCSTKAEEEDARETRRCVDVEKPKISLKFSSVSLKLFKD